MVLDRRWLGLGVLAMACGPAEVGWSVAPAGALGLQDAQGCAWTLLSGGWTVSPRALPTAARQDAVVWPAFDVTVPNGALDYGPSVSTDGARYGRVWLGVSEIEVQGTLTCPDAAPVALAWAGTAMTDVGCKGAALASADGSTTRFAITVGPRWPWGAAVDAREVLEAASQVAAQGPVALGDLALGEGTLAEEASAVLAGALAVQGADCALSGAAWSD